jgi:hypothetical protein
VAQWLVLQPRLRGAVAWLLLSAIQGLIAFLLVVTLDPTALLVAGWFVLGALLLILVAVGLIQWLVLRQAGRQAGWWLLAYGLSWGLGIAALSLIMGTPAAGVVLGALFGAITGVALVWILPGRQREPRGA